jgi:hypothetical protein
MNEMTALVKFNLKRAYLYHWFISDFDKNYNTWRWSCEAETCRRLIENKKWMCYIDGQKNKYSVFDKIYYYWAKPKSWVSSWLSVQYYSFVTWMYNFMLLLWLFFRDISLCSPLNVNRCFGKIFNYLQFRKISQARDQYKVSSKLYLFFGPEDWDTYSSETPADFNELQGAIFKKTVLNKNLINFRKRKRISVRRAYLFRILKVIDLIKYLNASLICFCTWFIFNKLQSKNVTTICNTMLDVRSTTAICVMLTSFVTKAFWKKKNLISNQWIYLHK